MSICAKSQSLCAACVLQLHDRERVESREKLVGREGIEPPTNSV